MIIRSNSQLSRIAAVAIAVLCLATLVGQVSAAPVNWVPAANGDWEVATNWSSNPSLGIATK